MVITKLTYFGIPLTHVLVLLVDQCLLYLLYLLTMTQTLSPYSVSTYIKYETVIASKPIY